MLGLKLPTDLRWAHMAERDLHALLTDHAWCEHKAAANALSLINRYPQHTEMVDELARIAQEEIAHFGQVLQKVVARGWTLGPERKDDYVNEVLDFVRKEGSAEERLVDRLLFAAMIEARSCERFKLLTETMKDEDLRTFYRDLMVSEANHYAVFIGFARQYGGRVDVDARWKAFLEHEAGVVARYGEAPTMHG
ncbi:MAG: tRNA-(ms[2]io[6]A)-hydroxylase [Flavobacteriales bacterium]|nr:tRNA-(ms[2]io[6]A)-hydroxylase [Flavobacteriales bacterium]